MTGYTGLTLISPGCCTYEEYTDTYTVTDLHNHIYGVFVGRIIHIRGMSTDGGYNSESVIRYASRALGLATREDEQSDDVMEKGSTYKGFVSGDEETTRGFAAPQDSQIKVRQRTHRDGLKSGKNIMSLPGAMKFNQLSMSPADLQLLDSKNSRC